MLWQWTLLGNAFTKGSPSKGSRVKSLFLKKSIRQLSIENVLPNIYSLLLQFPRTLENRRAEKTVAAQRYLRRHDHDWCGALQMGSENRKTISGKNEGNLSTHMLLHLFIFFMDY